MFCRWANHSRSPWEACGQLHPSNFSTRLFSTGNAVSLDPLPKDQLSLPESWLKQDRFSRALEGLFERNTKWQHAAAALARGKLVVTILGSSVTSGCGANEPWELYTSNGSQLFGYHSSWSRCRLDLSWGRRFHDELLQLLHHWLPHGHGQKRHALQTTIQYKNAVDAGCTPLSALVVGPALTLCDSQRTCALPLAVRQTGRTARRATWAPTPTLSSSRRRTICGAVT